MQSPQSTVIVITSAEDVTANLVIMALNERRGVQVARVDPADIGEVLSFDAHMGAELGQWSGRLHTPSRDVALDELGRCTTAAPALSPAASLTYRRGTENSPPQRPGMDLAVSSITCTVPRTSTIPA